MPRFEGKVVIVTGSSSGIGQAVLLSFANEGASVVLHGTNEERIQKTFELLKKQNISDDKILVVKGPIEDEQLQDKLINETVEKFRKIDVLINNAGLTKADGLDAHSADNLDYVFKVNTRAPFRLVQLALPHLEKTKGNIINTSSIAAIKKPIDHDMITVYGMSKAALDTFTRYESQRLAKHGVRINNINPGSFETNIAQRGEPIYTKVEVEKMQNGPNFMDTIPVGRSGLPSEIAPLYLHLADNQVSGFITGACWVIDGGSNEYAPKF